MHKKYRLLFLKNPRMIISLIEIVDEIVFYSDNFQSKNNKCNWNEKISNSCYLPFQAVYAAETTHQH